MKGRPAESMRKMKGAMAGAPDRAREKVSPSAARVWSHVARWTFVRRYR